MTLHAHTDTAADAADAVANGAVLDIALNKLKASPRNARKVPHSAADIESRAASIAAKGLLQPLVVEPEMDETGVVTGFWLVTIGEGRRQAFRLMASRKTIKKTHPVRCVIDTVNDPAEISLDENVSRRDMHPADQFEAFRDLNERKGWGAEEIGARFGVSPQVVRQRLRLGADGLTLDQLMAFAVSEDHARQEQVYEALSFNRSAPLIRRAMTEAKVPADDRRALFVGIEAYEEAGGSILRDLFTEDHGGWLEDVGLLDRLAAEKIALMAEDIRDAEGWKWAQGYLDYPSSHGLARVYPRKVERTPEQQAEIDAVGAEYDALVEQWSHVEDLPPDIEARLAEIDAQLEAFGDGHAFDADDIARGGVFVILGHDGSALAERGLIRPEDAKPVAEPEAAEPDKTGQAGGTDGAGAHVEPRLAEAEEVEEPDGLTPLSDRLVADLTAHRTAGLRDALAENPDAALLVTLHALVLRAFFVGCPIATCVDIRMGSASLGREADGIEDSPAERRIAERHEAWARQLPDSAQEAWGFVIGLDGDSRASLLAHCVGLSVYAVHGWERRPAAWDHADALASMLSLDMTVYWTPTSRSYLSRVTKARIIEAVTEGVSAEAARRLDGLKKTEMAKAAEPLLAGSGWLPPLLRTAAQTSGAEEAETDPVEAVPAAAE